MRTIVIGKLCSFAGKESKLMMLIKTNAYSVIIQIINVCKCLVFVVNKVLALFFSLSNG